MREPDAHYFSLAEGDRAILEDVCRLREEFATSFDSGRDLTSVLRSASPDVLRYLDPIEFVDDDMVEQMRVVGVELAAAPSIEGFRRLSGRRLVSSHSAGRPAVAVAPDGLILAVWIEWQGEVGEFVVATMFDSAGHVISPTNVVSGAPADCYRPAAVFAADGTPWVSYGWRRDGHAEVVATTWSDGAWTQPEVISDREHGPAFNQEFVAHADGSLHAAWQQYQEGRFQVFARTYAHGAWSGSSRVHPSSGSQWDPTLAAGDDGSLVLAWCEWREGTYRILLRNGGAAGDPAVTVVSSPSGYALHPSLAIDGDGHVWLAFDEIDIPEHGQSGPTRLRRLEELMAPPRDTPQGGRYLGPEILLDFSARIRVVRVTKDGVVDDGSGLLGPGVQLGPAALPKLSSGERGGLVVAYRALRRVPFGGYYWEVVVQTLGPDGWSGPAVLAESDGPPEEVGIAAGSTVVWQHDGRRSRALEWTEVFGGTDTPFLRHHLGEAAWNSTHGPGRISYVVLPFAGDGPPAIAGTADLHVETARSEDGSGDTPAKGQRITAGDRTYLVAWGDLHRHSLVSRCTVADEPSLEDYYRYSQDVFSYDFWALTDHAENSSAHQWWTCKKLADLFLVEGSFVPLYGFEWTSHYGHQNVIFGDVSRSAPIFSARASSTNTPTKLWEGLDAYSDHPAITIPHHPGAVFVEYDWDYFDPRFLRLVEIFQACRGNYESPEAFRRFADATGTEGYVVDGLERGHRFGFVASSDHGTGASYVGAFVDELTRGDVFEALYDRRTVAATVRGFLVDFRVNGALAGREISAGGPLQLGVSVSGVRELARIDVIRNGVVIESVQPIVAKTADEIAVDLRVEWGRADQTVDWSGTLSVQDGRILGTEYWSPAIRNVTHSQVAWESRPIHLSGVFGGLRDGIECTVVGPASAEVEVLTSLGVLRASLGDLDEGHTVTTTTEVGGGIAMGPGIGGLIGLGSSTIEHSWEDDPPGAVWYYARAIQTDGEMAWSSPIWVEPT